MENDFQNESAEQDSSQIVANTASYGSEGRLYLNNVADNYVGRKPKAREILITEVDHGYIIKIGCQTLALETQTSLFLNLKKYLEDPQGIEQRWMSNDLKL